MPDREAALTALRIAIQTELDGHAFYRKFAEQTQDAAARAMFERLAQDEAMHLELLQHAQDRLQATGQWLPHKGMDLEPVEGAPIFSRERVAQNVVAYTSDLSALRVAYLIEKDAVDFYSRAAEQTDDPDGKGMFLDLAEMERSHLRLLQNEYDFLQEQFQSAMGFAPF